MKTTIADHPGARREEPGLPVGAKKHEGCFFYEAEQEFDAQGVGRGTRWEE